MSTAGLLLGMFTMQASLVNYVCTPVQEIAAIHPSTTQREQVERTLCSSSSQQVRLG